MTTYETTKLITRPAIAISKNSRTRRNAHTGLATDKLTLNSKRLLLVPLFRYRVVLGMKFEYSLQ